MKKLLGFASLLLLLAACSSGPSGPSGELPEFTGVKIGKPYSIAGKWYKPERDDTYNRVGMASWYGPGFNGKRTANGEVFNQYDMTAAHPTLPMPSLVKVTNLTNQHQAIVRINDRGPFHGGRIIDLSKAAAEKLGVLATGVARVRVEYLPEETQIYIASKGKIFPDLDDTSVDTEFASNVMPREQLDLSAEQDAKYYPVEVKELAKDDFIPAPIQIANNSGIVVDSAPILSVESKESSNLTPFVKPAYADDTAPYPSALTQKPVMQNTEVQASSLPAALPEAPREMSSASTIAEKALDPIKQPPVSIASTSEKKLKLVETIPNQYDVEMVEIAKAKLPHEQRLAKRPPSLQKLKEAKKSEAAPTNKVILSTWSVQIASFSERKNAEALTQKLLPLGQPELQPVLVDGVQWYRVYLHPLAGAEKEKLICELQKIGLRDARIVN